MALSGDNPLMEKKKVRIKQRLSVTRTEALCSGTDAAVSGSFCQFEKYMRSNLKGRYSIDVIDLLENPKLARGDQILAIPTLVRKLPEPIRKIIWKLV